jgi:glutaredoxin 3
MDSPIELYVTSSCPFCESAREDLEWRGVDFVEYDVDRDPAARARLLAITGGNRTVPVVAQDGKVVQTGWHGRGCIV